MNKWFRIIFGLCALIVLVCFVVFGLRLIHRKYVNYVKTITLKEAPAGVGVKIFFFHHSIGDCIWKGGVPQWFKSYNKRSSKNYLIIEQSFPKSKSFGYGWNNYPYDYWNIWVNNAGLEPYENEPTLEMIVKKYDIIIWKHCSPVSIILEDAGNPSVSSDTKSIENYMLQYEALKTKMNQFVDNIFIVWIGAARTKRATTEENARLAQSFFNWVRDEWDQPGDNIFLWDFYEIETEGGIYLRDEYAMDDVNSHPSRTFSKEVAPLFCQRIVDIIEGRGDQSSITGK